jgi:hypothetical protein
MTNTILGVGKVQNGRVSFVSNVGGFVRPVSKPVVTREPAVKHEVTMTKPMEVIDVPYFMKDRKPEPMGQVIYVNFAKEQEEEEELDKGEKIAEALDDIFNHVGKKIKRNPVFKYFFGEDEE